MKKGRAATAVDLVSFAGCPNAPEARAQLLRAFAAAGLVPRWTEHEAGDPSLPQHARGFGSPTILVDGQDVSGAAAPESAAACRLYRDENGVRAGVPPLSRIVTALLAAPRRRGRLSRSSLGAVPGFTVALLPKLACPACWPAYASLLGSLGLSVLLDSAWLLSITALFLAVTLGCLAYRARQRRGFGPFLVGLVASTLILTAKFVFDARVALYGGVALLAGASLWNAWPERDSSGASCSACVPAAAAPSIPREASEKEVGP